MLGQIADQKALATIIAKAKNPALDEATRTYYVQGLWQADAQAMSGQLTELLQPSQPAEVRRSAALAIGYAADPANDQLLLDMLQEPGAQARGGVCDRARRQPGGGHELYKQIESDRELREVLQDFLMADDTDYFNLITAQHFASGEVFRRLEVAGRTPQRQGRADLQLSLDPDHRAPEGGLGRPGWPQPHATSAPSSTKRCAAKSPEAQASPPRRSVGHGRARAAHPLARRGWPGQQEARETLLRDNRGAIDPKG